MPRKSLADFHVDQALEGEVLDAVRGVPALYWHLAGELNQALFTGENAEAFRDIAGQLNEQAGSWDGTEPEELEACRGKVARLRDLHQRRGLALALQGAADGLEKDAAEAVLERLGAEVAALQNQAREDNAGRLVQVPDLFPELLEEVAKRRRAVKERGVAAVGLPTGLKTLDRLLGGLQTGLHLLAAEPGAGKTSLALQLAGHVAREAPVVFVSFEETLSRLALKALCQRAGLESKKYADGYGDPEDLRRAVRDHGAELARLCLVEGTSKLNIALVKARALQAVARWKAAHPPLVVVDYLQRWASLRRESTEYRLLVNLMVAELRELALRLDCPVLAIASQNRAGQGEARMTSLKESAELEYSADSIWFLSEENGGGAGTVRDLVLTVAKNRYGDKGKLSLVFKPAVGTFAEKAW